MRSLAFIVLLTIIALSVSVKPKRNHEFVDMFTKDPGMMIDLASGDYLTLLPDSIEPFVRKVLGKEKKTGVAGFMQTAQGLLGGSGSQSPLDGLMGGQSAGSGFASLLGGLTGGNNNQNAGSSSGLSSLLGSFTGGSSQDSGSAGGISSLLNGFTGGNQQPAKQESGGNFLSNLFGHKAQMKHKSARRLARKAH